MEMLMALDLGFEFVEKALNMLALCEYRVNVAVPD